MRLWTKYGFFDVVRDDRPGAKPYDLIVGAYQRELLQKLKDQLNLTGEIHKVTDREYSFVIETTNIDWCAILSKMVAEL